MRGTTVQLRVKHNTIYCNFILRAKMVKDIVFELHEAGGGPPNVMVPSVMLTVIQPPGAGRQGCREWRAQGQRRGRDVRRTARRLRARGILRCASLLLGGSAA